MLLYHGSPVLNLNKLIIGLADKQGVGIYLTDNLNQAEIYAKDGGQVYTVELDISNILDFSNENLMLEIFKDALNEPYVREEINFLSCGAGVFSNLLGYIPSNKREIIIKTLDNYPVYKIPSLGFRGYYNYVVKDSSLIRIIK